MVIRIVLATSLFLLPCMATTLTDLAYSNVSIAASPFNLLLTADTLFSLEKRQLVCEVPGGPICDAIHCCRPGQQCCPLGCCSISENCFGTGRCCPKTAQQCGGLACCPQTTTCCGSTCCTSSEICERNECIDKTLEKKVVRFKTEARNKELLRNMCNGMRGKNTETLTYRGPDLAERDRTRNQAGCVDGYCANQIALGLVPATHNSCDEYPPASSLEGGNARPVLQRAINCIPARQNSSQGGKFGGFQSQLRKQGLTFQRGDKFVISIDCDEVLGPKLSGNEQVKSDAATDSEDFQVEKHDPAPTLKARDQGTVTQSGNETVDTSLVFEDGQTLSYLLVPFGDLTPGRYSASIKCDAGSTVGAYVLDEDGYNITTSDAGITSGQTQQYTFTLQYTSIGAALLVGTNDNNTKITWDLNGTLGNFTTTSSELPTGTSAQVPNGAQSKKITLNMIWLMAVAWLLESHQ